MPRRAIDKIVSREYAQKLSKELHERGVKIVFTNGCFDIIHRGHVEYLEFARSLGDILIIGLNTDDSVRRLKGPTRPINRFEDRAYVLASLEVVDYVVGFGEDTPFELIREVIPDVLVKGGDYRPEDVVGRDIVEEHGGKLVLAPFKDGYSTTALIKRIKELG